MSPSRPHAIRAAGQARLTRSTAALVWLTVAGAALVFVEPAPFDVLALLSIAVTAAAGIRAPRDLAPFWLLLMIFCAGGYLGLAIAQWIVQAHHGSIKVESEQGKGARFKIDLPVS